MSRCKDWKDTSFECEVIRNEYCCKPEGGLVYNEQCEDSIWLCGCFKEKDSISWDTYKCTPYAVCSGRSIGYSVDLEPIRKVALNIIIVPLLVETISGRGFCVYHATSALESHCLSC